MIMVRATKRRNFLFDLVGNEHCEIQISSDTDDLGRDFALIRLSGFKGWRMKKGEIFELIVKGLGVYALILAIGSVPHAVSGLFVLLAKGEMGMGSMNYGYLMITQSVSPIAMCLLYFWVARNLLRSGSIVSWAMGMGSRARQFSDQTEQ